MANSAISAYMRADEMWSRGGAVADTVGATDSDYTNEWLVEGIPGRPVLATSGTVTWTVTNTSGYVDTAIVNNYRVDAGRAITIGGDISATITPPATRPNGIPLGLWSSIAVNSTVGTVTLGVSGNSTSVIVGEFILGKRRLLPRGGLLVDGLSDDPIGFAQPTLKYGSVNPFDPAQAARAIVGTIRCNDSELEDIMAWYDAQRNESRPSAFILNINSPLARVVTMQTPSVRREGLLWRVGLDLREFPRVRW